MLKKLAVGGGWESASGAAIEDAAGRLQLSPM